MSRNKLEVDVKETSSGFAEKSVPQQRRRGYCKRQHFNNLQFYRSCDSEAEHLGGGAGHVAVFSRMAELAAETRRTGFH